MAQVGDGALMQAALLGVALGPGQILAVDIGALALIGLGTALRDHRRVAVGLQLARPHPGGVTGRG